MNEQAFLSLCRYKKIQEPCEICHGIGSRYYSSGSTWRGGMGTASFKLDVCDSCWGSGDQSNPWTDLRAQEANEKRRIAEGAAELFAYRCGVALRSMRPGIRELCSELEKFSRGRKARADGFDTATRCLAKLLTELCDAQEAAEKSKSR